MDLTQLLDVAAHQGPAVIALIVWAESRALPILREIRETHALTRAIAEKVGAVLPAPVTGSLL